jgi:hypothetical protein
MYSWIMVKHLLNLLIRCAQIYNSVTSLLHPALLTKTFNWPQLKTSNESSVRVGAWSLCSEHLIDRIILQEQSYIRHCFRREIFYKMLFPTAI